MASYENRVCDLLTQEQVSPFLIRDPGKQEDGPAGPGCTWQPPPEVADPTLSVAILSKAGYGLDGVYERKGKWKLFEDAGEINGYPAVHLDAVGMAKDGRCSTVVGVRWDLVFDAIVQINRKTSPGYSTPCEVSDRVASSVIDTLKKGSR